MLKQYFSGRSAFAKNIIALVSGTALAQVVNFAFSILLARLYTPADFGVLSVFLTIVSFAIVVSAGKYDVALVASQNREEAKGLASLGIIITIIAAVLTLLGVWIVYATPINIYQQNPVRRWFYFIPVSIMLLSVFQVLWMWNVREKRFKSISFIRPLEAFVINGLCIILKGYKAFGLLAGTLSGQFISASIITVMSFSKEGKGIFFTPFKRLKELALKYSDFPKINILQGFVETLQMGMVILVATNYFSAAEVGFYAYCMRVLQAPARLVTLPLAHVFFAEASEQYREGKPLYPLVKRVTYQAGLWLIAIPVVLIVAGPMLFRIIFGAQWQEAGVYAAILSPWIFLDMIRGPIVQVASIIGKQHKILVISIVSNAILLISLIFGIWYGLHFKTILILVSATQSIMCAYLIGVIFKMSQTDKI
jgi:O-antigen/teichoic acid export membrane protein